MMTNPAVDVSTISRIEHDEAMRITAVEFDRALALFRSLDAGDWVKPTDCDLWDVRGVVLHLLGSAEANASLVEQLRQMYKGSRLKKTINSPYWWDGANEYQIAKHAALADGDIAAAYAAITPKATETRTKLPKVVRSLPVLNLPEPVGRKPLGFLTDMGFTRDVWMHRVDIRRATGKTMELTAEHDGRIVADIVADWSTTHADPFTLELDGPAGGHFTRGSGGEHVRIDAVEFTRILSLRETGTGVLANPFPL
ncbi:MAG TPA: maleylpyruvate isomerase family mycothiol-dependent enzyme [Acidimicrobiia bacterium]|nr:maleylpyruvate isomerase family mycothiol-dependent enzyme [Acidimicrobiia bacterium]